jgi:hypothetical protein
MDPQVVGILAPMVVGAITIVTIGAVILLRPIARPLGELLRAMTLERTDNTRSREIEQVKQILTAMDSRLSLIEERQSFTEALLESGRAQKRVPESAGETGERV